MRGAVLAVAGERIIEGDLPLVFISQNAEVFFFVELETILNQGKGGIWRQPEIKMALAPATFVVSGKS